MVTSDDVRQLQDEVAAYQTQLALAVEALKPPLSASDDAKWTALAKRAINFAGRDATIIDATEAYNTGRAVLTDLNTFRAYLATLSPTLPLPSSSPVPAPASGDLFGEGMGIAEMLVFYLVLRELR